MKKFEDVNILVVGDIMLDRYIVGDVKRISPEAPVPIVHVIEEYSTLGGCGNVVRNIRSLGAMVTCLASIAADEAGNQISKSLIELGVNSKLITASHVTVVKERIVAGERKTQMLRVDREIPLSINPERAINAIRGLDIEFDIVVVSDYNKGLVSPELMEYLRGKYNKIIVDPKPAHLYSYGKVFMLTPNENEFNTIIVYSTVQPEAEHILVTQGKKGMRLFDSSNPDRNLWTHMDIPAKPVEVYNVSGAGDTAVAVLAVCNAAGFSVLDSAIVANACAGYVVTQPGTTAIEKHIFDEILVDEGFKLYYD